jgi:predicted ester cyclase
MRNPVILSAVLLAAGAGALAAQQYGPIPGARTGGSSNIKVLGHLTLDSIDKTADITIEQEAVLGLAADAASAATARIQSGALRVTGDATSEKLVLRLDEVVPTTLLVDVGDDGTADFSFDRSRFRSIDVRGLGGDDELRVDQSGGAFPGEFVTLDGGYGADTLRSGNGDDVVIGGPGADDLAAGEGSDLALLGTGDDRFAWHAGDGADNVEGEGGVDAIDFHGSADADVLDVTAAGDRVRLDRFGFESFDADGIRRIDVHPHGGTDNFAVNPLDGTDVRTVAVDLQPDDAADRVLVQGTGGADQPRIAPSGAGVLVSGLFAQVRVGGADGLDDLDFWGQEGADVVTTAMGASGPGTINVDGGDDADTLRFEGTANDDQIDTIANGAEVSTVAAGTARVDTTAVESTVLRGLGGGDTTSAVGNLAALTTLTIEGGAGRDTLRGGNGPDLILGGPDDDFADGNQGNDQARLGDGADHFGWDPGDGSDTVDGEAGADALDFNGSNIGEVFDVAANGARWRFARNVASIVMDLGTVERLNVRMLGGADVLTVNELTGTPLRTVAADFVSADSQPDAVVARGTDGADRPRLAADGADAVVSGLFTQVRGTNAEAGLDDVNVATLGGADLIATGVGVAGAASFNVDGGDDADTLRYDGTAGDDEIQSVANGAEAATTAPGSSRVDTLAVESTLIRTLGGSDSTSAVGNLAALTSLRVEGGDQDDVLRGGNGADTLVGGAGDDLVDGNQGNDLALLGSGQDAFFWDPGDGSDIVEGQTGGDALAFNGSNIGELIALTPNGPRVQLTRNIASIVMDLAGIEQVGVRLLGGADGFTVDDMTGTAVTTVDADLSQALGGADGTADTVTVNGTDGPDAVQVTRSGDQVHSAGLAALTRVAGSEQADTLNIRTLAGDDDITVTPDVFTLITPLPDLGTDE